MSDYRINVGGSATLKRQSPTEFRIHGSDGSTMRIFVKDGRLEIDHDTRGACSSCGGSGWTENMDGYRFACTHCNAPSYAKPEPRQ